MHPEGWHHSGSEPLKKRAADVLDGASNAPTQVIDGRLEQLRSSALGFHNLTNYIAGALLETGGLWPAYTLVLEQPREAALSGR